MIKLIHGDCLEQLKNLEDNSVDSIVTDPPYGLSFMGKKWDYDVPSEDVWRECLRVLKPGGHLLSFAGTRTQHRMAVRIEDAGFEIRDMIAWVYGSGFPKSLNIGKAVDKLQGNEREDLGESEYASRASSSQPFGQGSDGANDTRRITKGTSPYEGWGTALKPALEPITVARKPLIGTVAENVLTYGTGGINIDGCRVGTDVVRKNTAGGLGYMLKAEPTSGTGTHYTDQGRFPANLIHDGSEEVVGLFPQQKSPKTYTRSTAAKDSNIDWNPKEADTEQLGYGDQGSVARFFYCAKASKKDRDEGLEGFIAKERVRQGLAGEKDNTFSRNSHPTVKPTDLMRYLCRLVTPPNGIVLDPFMGSGSTGKAAKLEGFSFIGIEREGEYIDIAKARIGE